MAVHGGPTNVAMRVSTDDVPTDDVPTDDVPIDDVPTDDVYDDDDDGNGWVVMVALQHCKHGTARASRRLERPAACL